MLFIHDVIEWNIEDPKGKSPTLSGRSIIAFVIKGNFEGSDKTKKK
ncbi:MAG: hypothetical protein WBQ25_14145 [Nitrososphaeraceae archaeon]